MAGICGGLTSGQGGNTAERPTNPPTSTLASEEATGEIPRGLTEPSRLPTQLTDPGVSEPFTFDSCPVTMAEIWDWPVAIPLEPPDLAFEDVVSKGDTGTLFASEDGFTLLSLGLLGVEVVASLDDGLTWTEYEGPDRPTPAEFGLDGPIRLYDFEWNLSRPGLGGTVEIITGMGPFGLCLPVQGEAGVMVHPLPFGADGEVRNPRLVGVADESVVMLVERWDRAEITFDLGDVTVGM